MQSWRRFRDDLIADPSRLTDPSRIALKQGWVPLFTLTKWLRRRTGRDSAAILRWACSRSVSSECRFRLPRGDASLWRVTKPERPEHKPGGAVTVKWITILSFAAVGLEASTNENWAQNLSTEDARRAALHACMSGRATLTGLSRCWPHIPPPWFPSSMPPSRLSGWSPRAFRRTSSIGTVAASRARLSGSRSGNDCQSRSAQACYT